VAPRVKHARGAHAFELDDYHNAKLHPGAVVIPAALAIAEEINASGEKLLLAIAAGYEVMIRSSLALEPSAARLRGWHLTGACGPFGAAAACAVLLGLDAERTAWALGLAGVQRRWRDEQAAARGQGGAFGCAGGGAGRERLYRADADL
jgi:2-methylcitrate dehydratase PrpD